MVSPRTPRRVVKRYGPSGIGTRAGLVPKNGEAGMMRPGQIVRKRAPGTGLGIETSASVYDLPQQKPTNEIEEYLITEEQEGDISNIDYENNLLQRALAAFWLAEARGDGYVEMEESEWGAWHRHETMEREIERRVAERLKAVESASRIRRASAAATPSSSSSPGQPGLLMPGGFAALGAVSSSPNLPIHHHSDSALPARLTRESMPPATPPSSSTEFLDRLQPTQYTAYSPYLGSAGSAARKSTPSLGRAPVPKLRPQASASDMNFRSVTTESDASGAAARRTSPQRRMLVGGVPQPGSSYHPGTHPSLATRSEPDVRPIGSGEERTAVGASGWATAGPLRRRMDGSSK